MKRIIKYSVLGLTLLLCGPLYMLAYGGDAAPARGDDGWRFASRDSAGISPLPSAHPDAVIQVFAARTWGWRGNVAVHPWIATKAAGADSYLTHQVIGFRARRGLPVVQTQEDLPDRRWYGNVPELLVDIRGAEAERLLPKVLAAVASYPYPDSYTTWPGPNSNTFAAHVGRQVPELGLVLPVTAIGKDYLPGGALLAATPSGSGYQLSLLGALGITAGIAEGLEFNVLGLAFGIDVRRPAVKLPGIGRVGMAILDAETTLEQQATLEQQSSRDPYQEGEVTP
jgi:hypothetical protein